MARCLASAFAIALFALASLSSQRYSRADAAVGDDDDASDDVGRRLGSRRRRRRALRDARALHNYTSQALPTVEATLNVASGSINASLTAAAAAADGTPSDAVARSLDPYCHARAHTGYAGDGAAVWGLGPRGLHTADAGQCCEACKAHNAICGSPEANGKSWWPAQPERRCGRDVKRACTIWTFCPEERCFAFDIHKHEFGECWLKYQGDEPPYTRPKDPHFGHRTYPEIMRHAPRRKWPWPVDEKIWQGPMPLYVPWMSGVLADPSVSVVSSEPNDRWRERWCKKHGPCDGEPYA